MDLKAKREALREEIERAFEGVALGGGTTIKQAAYIDEHWVDMPPEIETHEVVDDWRKISYDDLESSMMPFAYANPEGFRYYLPAYMMWTLQKLEDYSEVYNSNADVNSDDFVDTWKVDRLIYALQIIRRHNLEAYAIERFAILSPSQSQVTARYLEFMAKHNNAVKENSYVSECAQEALQDYWGKFLLPPSL